MKSRSTDQHAKSHVVPGSESHLYGKRGVTSNQFRTDDITLCFMPAGISDEPLIDHAGLALNNNIGVCLDWVYPKAQPLLIVVAKLFDSKGM